MSGRRSILLAALVALLQIGFLGWMIQGRASILRHGQEVLLRVEPVDPRDLLRGDYVRLGYEASRVPANIVTGLQEGVWPGYATEMRIRLAKQPDNYWMPVAGVLGSALTGVAEQGQVDIKATLSGETTDADGVRILTVDYGIERFYLPEGEGLAIEKDMGIRPFGILAAIDSHGAAQIKSLMDGDVMLYAEPLY